MKRLSHARTREYYFANRKTGMVLSERETLICRLVAQCKPDKEIAFELGISETRVGNHLRVLYKRAGVNTRVGLVLWFLIRSASREISMAVEEIFPWSRKWK